MTALSAGQATLPENRPVSDPYAFLAWGGTRLYQPSRLSDSLFG
jgi:hypothetical protein